MQPTFRQVPPSLPRFSIQTVWRCQRFSDGPHFSAGTTTLLVTHLETLLGGLDGSDISTRATADDGEVVAAGLRGEVADTDEVASGGVGRARVGEGAEEVGRLWWGLVIGLAREHSESSDCHSGGGCACVCCRRCCCCLCCCEGYVRGVPGRTLWVGCGRVGGEEGEVSPSGRR